MLGMSALTYKDEIINLLGNSFDVEMCEIKRQGISEYFIYLEGSTDKQHLFDQAVEPISQYDGTINGVDDLSTATRLTVQLTILNGVKTASEHIAFGDVVYVGDNALISFSLRKVAMRAVSEPPTSTVLKGPREGFSEELHTNVSLLRRRLKTPSLRLEKLTVGKYSQTDVIIAYIDGIADTKVVEKIRERISGINIDGIIDSSYVAKFLEDRAYSLFRQVGTTEKPDILSAKMLEGRVGIIVDGSPIVLTLPFLLFEDLQNSNDYFKRDVRASFIRLIRLFGGILAVLLPAVYIAVQEYQYQMIPIKLIITILNATSGTPLSPTLEMFFVILLFEIINETSIRMPKYVGMAVSLVGAIVLGDTAVKAGILSSPAVLITALSGLGLYCIPDEAGTFSMLRIIFLGIAAVLGMYGIVLGLVALTVYAVSINGYFTAYTAPYAPDYPEDRKDGVIKHALKEMKTRPKSIPNNNTVRQSDAQIKEQE